MRVRILGHLEQWLEEVDNDLLEIVHQAARLVDVKESRHLDEPANVIGKEFVVHDPGSELVPFIERSAIDGDAPLNHLVLARLKIRDDFLGDLGKIPTLDKVVRLEKDGSQTRFPYRVVLEIEFIETMKGICVSLMK